MRDNPTGYETIILHESGKLVRGQDSELPTIRTAVDKGVDDALFIPAREEIKDTVDLDEYGPGTHLATVHYDLRTKEYDVEFEVDIDDEDESEDEDGNEAGSEAESEAE